MLEILKAILFGIVEGITEWLPISSTGHLILLDELVGLKVSEAFYEMFQVVIQLGAIGAVIVLLMWLYVTALILIMGAEWNGVLMGLRKERAANDGKL